MCNLNIKHRRHFIYRMKPKHSLTFVASLAFLNLVRCDVFITTRFFYTTIDIRFQIDQFNDLYECLCQTTTHKCTVTLNYISWHSYYAEQTHTVDLKDQNNISCKYYKCTYSSSFYRDSFTCTKEESPSCDKLPRTQSISYQRSNCGQNSCVSILWESSEEHVDFSSVRDIVNCTSNCGCSTRIQSTTATTTPKPTVRSIFIGKPRTTKPSTTLKTTTIKTTSTSKLTTIPTTRETSPAETTPQTTVLVTPSTVTTSSEVRETTSPDVPETTSPDVRETTETNTTSDLVSDAQTQNDPMPIIVGVLVAAILVASIAAVAVFLWKRKKEITQKPPSDSHEYANLPPASGSVKGVDKTSSAVSSSQDFPRSNTNYDVIDDSINYNNDGAKYFSLANQTSHNTAQIDNQPYVNFYPSRSRTTAPREGTHMKDTSDITSPGYITILNTLEDTDDLTNNIYEFANQIFGNDPECPAVSNSFTHLNNVQSQNRTNKLIPNASAATATAKSHPHNLDAYENDTSNPNEATYANTKASLDKQTWQQTTQPLQVYESAKQIDDSIYTDSVYSVSNSDINSDTTYSIAANPTINTDQADPSHPHVYAHLSKDAPSMVNPYNALQESNDAPIPKQANIQQVNFRTNSDTIQVYSVAEPIPEFLPERDIDNQYQGIDSTDDQCVDTYTSLGENLPGVVCPELIELNDPSGCQMSNDKIYFELEK